MSTPTPTPAPAASRRPPPGRLKRLLFALVPLLVLYGVAEAILTPIAWFRWWDRSMTLHDQSGRTLQFDPIRGFRATTTPSRYVRFSNGQLEFVGVHRGNHEGFPDRDDFGPERPAGGRRRIAVFGDSFTAGSFLGQNWPDRVEDLALAAGRPIELLNFAIDGGGLANWWSIVRGLIEPQGYELDAVVFAVYQGDLRRRFSFLDDRMDEHHRFARLPTWAPAAHPQTLAEARALLIEHNQSPDSVVIVGSEEFEGALQGHWPPTIERRLRPYLLGRVVWWLRTLARAPAAPPAVAPETDPDRQRLIADLRRFLEARRIPAIVVVVPDRNQYLAPDAESAVLHEEARRFAADLGARFLDGRQILDGLSPSQVRALYFPYDGHWNQAGSNRFAAWLDPILAKPAEFDRRP